MRLLGVLLVAASVAAQTPLPSLNADIKESSVSGLSAGGYFAVQMHLAFSSIMKGAAIFAGGPYNCAQGNMGTALTTCMNPFSPINPQTYIQTTELRSTLGVIDEVSNLKSHKVYLWIGALDGTVRPPVMQALHTYYKHFVPEENLVYIGDMIAAHTQPTDDPINTNACTSSTTPYISNCQYDAAGVALQHIYGPLKPRNNGPLTGRLVTFDQTEFIRGNSMNPTGFVYIPRACDDKEPCRLHISFHGCQQYAAVVGDRYARNSGYNKWADTNNIIVLYPQAINSVMMPMNPNGCFDWWGYNGDGLTYDTHSGIQMAAIKKMIERLTSGHDPIPPLPPPAGVRVSNTSDHTVGLAWTHVDEARAYVVYRDGRDVTPSPVRGLEFYDQGLQSGTRYTYTVSALDQDGRHGEESTPVTARTSGTPPPLQAPTGLASTGATARSISLAWVSVPNANSYQVYRNGQPIGTTQTNTFIDQGLTPSTQYQYAVSGRNSEGEGARSDPVTASTTADWTCRTFLDNNWNHVAAGRATVSLGMVFALGSGNAMGLWNIGTITTLAHTADAFYIVGNCPTIVNTTSTA